MEQKLAIISKCIRQSPKLTKLRALLRTKQIKPRCFVILINTLNDKCYIRELGTEILPTSAKHTCPVFKPSVMFPKKHGNWVFINLSTRSLKCTQRIIDSKNDIFQCIPTNVDIIGDTTVLRHRRNIYSAILGPDYVSLYCVKRHSIPNIIKKNQLVFENQLTKNWKNLIDKFEAHEVPLNKVASRVQKCYPGIAFNFSKL